MSKPYRRFEILRPLQFNDGQPVPRELITETLLELRQRFGSVSCETQTIRGQWQHSGEVYQDNLIRVFVDCSDAPEHRQFFVEYKEQLKARFRQLDTWLTTYPLEVL
jgi:hypothetical protein